VTIVGRTVCKLKMCMLDDWEDSFSSYLIRMQQCGNDHCLSSYSEAPEGCLMVEEDEKIIGHT